MPTRRRVASHDHVATWTAAVRERCGAVPAAVVDRLLGAAPLAYVENCSPDTAAQDIVALHGLVPGEIAVAVHSDHVPCRFRIRIRDAEAPLHRVLPVLASMGVDAID
jgi:NAD-specific glutamate dehydrogenase